MHIVIMGAGVVGVTTAYVLSSRGHQVTVIERNSTAAVECSFANGGQLSYSHVEPWANPAALSNIIKWIGKNDAPLVFRLRLDPHEWIWGARFLLNCRHSKSLETSKNMLRLSLYSRDTMHALAESTPLNFSYLKTGILHVFHHDKALELECKQAEYQKQYGCDYEILTPAQCVEKEPALAASKLSILGGVYFPLDESGDVYHFTQNLAELCVKQGVTFLYNSPISYVETGHNEVTHVVLQNGGTVKGDVYVNTLGAYSPVTLKNLRLRMPIYPMKGYSISLPVGDRKDAPFMSITDQLHKIVYSRLGNILRVAGTAEFAGYDHDLRKDRLAPIQRAVASLFPSVMTSETTEHMTEWACLRPSTPDGAPILGKTPYKNFYLNTGHGTLGWTLATGSAYVVADIVEGKVPQIDLTGLTAERL